MPAAFPSMLVVIALSIEAWAGAPRVDEGESRMSTSNTVSLPAPQREGSVSLERALQDRRTRREFGSQPLGLAHVSQLLWAMQGTTGPEGGRTAPSAGALYPLEIYVALGRAEGLAAGLYRYSSEKHALIRLSADDAREALAVAALGQQWVAQAAAVFVIGAVEARTTGKYGTRGTRFVHIEVGHAAQNALLQAASLGLNAGVVGAFDDERVAKALDLPADIAPLYLLAIGPRR